MQKLPKGPSTKGPSEMFTGDVYFDVIAKRRGTVSNAREHVAFSAVPYAWLAIMCLTSVTRRIVVLTECGVDLPFGPAQSTTTRKRRGRPAWLYMPAGSSAATPARRHHPELE